MDEVEHERLIEKEMAELRKTMSVPRMALASIWFVSEQHQKNFTDLIEKFSSFKNPEYASACYVCAHPEIFRRINWSKSDGPVGWYWGEWIGKDDNDPNGYHAESEIVGCLSSAYQSLVRAAVELYTGSKHHFNLMALIGNAGDDVYRVFIQMLEIRRNRFVIDLREKWGETADADPHSAD